MMERLTTPAFCYTHPLPDELVIGDKIAATILSEIGEVDRFDHPKKLVAFYWHRP